MQGWVTAQCELRRSTTRRALSGQKSQAPSFRAFRIVLSRDFPLQVRRCIFRGAPSRAAAFRGGESSARPKSGFSQVQTSEVHGETSASLFQHNFTGFLGRGRLFSRAQQDARTLASHMTSASGFSCRIGQCLRRWPEACKVSRNAEDVNVERETLLVRASREFVGTCRSLTRPRPYHTPSEARGAAIPGRCSVSSCTRTAWRSSEARIGVALLHQWHQVDDPVNRGVASVVDLEVQWFAGISFFRLRTVPEAHRLW